MSTPSQRPQARREGLLVLAAVALLLAYAIIGKRNLDFFVLDLGGLAFPRPVHAGFLLAWIAFGTPAAMFLSWSIAERIADFRIRHPFAPTTTPEQRAQSERRWIAGLSVAAAVLALIWRALVLRGARLTDDESAYQLMAELVATGRVSMPSYPMKEFFSNAFLINDGHMYSKYFMGWPALLAPGAAIGLPGLMNPIYFGLTVPPLYWILREHVSAGWARGGVIAMSTAPMLVFGAATLLSHTSCLCVLAWAWYAARRASTLQELTALRWPIALAAFLSVAFFIRPMTALGIGFPIAGHFLYDAFQLAPSARLRVRVYAAFGAVCALALAAFLLVNYAQTGSPFTVAYQLTPEKYPHMQTDNPVTFINITAIAFLRLSYEFLGWPIGLLPAMFALRLPYAHMAWRCVACFVILHLPLTDAGIDAFGPQHYYELALPLGVLCIIGFVEMERLLEVVSPHWRAAAPALLAGLMLASWLGYVPVRALSVRRMTRDILSPEAEVEKAGIHNAVVFAPIPWAPSCEGAPTVNWVLFRPNNDPALQNDILWVNQLGLMKDLELMKKVFPKRKGYVMLRNDCAIRLHPLDKIDPIMAPRLDQTEAPGSQLHLTD